MDYCETGVGEELTGSCLVDNNRLSLMQSQKECKSGCIAGLLYQLVLSRHLILQQKTNNVQFHCRADACDSTGHIILSACAWNILRIVAEQAKSKTKSLFLDHIIIFIPEPTLCRYPTFKGRSMYLFHGATEFIRVLVSIRLRLQFGWSSNPRHFFPWTFICWFAVRARIALSQSCQSGKVHA